MGKEDLLVDIANYLGFAECEDKEYRFCFRHTAKNKDRAFIVLSNKELDLEKFVADENIKGKASIISILVMDRTDLYIPKPIPTSIPKNINIIELIFYTDTMFGVGLHDAMKKIESIRDSIGSC